jgi:hypothetical protein
MPQSTPKDARELARLSPDCSFLLTHLVRQNDGKSKKEARASLHSILGKDSGTPSLWPSPIGWFNICSGTNSFDPSTRKWEQANLARSVCFTESTLAGLKAHRDVFKARYGLAFDRDLVFEWGANPCLNIRKELLRTKVKTHGDQNKRYVYNFIPFALQPYVNVINESFDATHEREWRYVGELSFAYSDVMFLFCPEKDFAKFSYAQQDGIPVLFDLMWLDRI